MIPVILSLGTKNTTGGRRSNRRIMICMSPNNQINTWIAFCLTHAREIHTEFEQKTYKSKKPAETKPADEEHMWRNTKSNSFENNNKS